MGILEKLEVPHAPGLTYTQMFLSVSYNCHTIWFCIVDRNLRPQNDDLTPVPKSQWTWRSINFVSL